MRKDKHSADIHQYDDIIHLPHHVSPSHPQMSLADRAAQFAPFAALTGHRAAISETARLTEQRIELDENAKAMLDEKLAVIKENLSAYPEISILYFQQDETKSGGAYVTVKGKIKKIDTYSRGIVMMDELYIPFADIYEIE